MNIKNHPRKINHSERKQSVLKAMAETLDWFSASDLQKRAMMSRDIMDEMLVILLDEGMVAESVVGCRSYFAITRHGVSAIITENV